MDEENDRLDHMTLNEMYKKLKEENIPNTLRDV